MDSKRITFIGLGLFLLGYLVVFLVKGDYEFLLYVAITGILVGILFGLDRKYAFKAPTVWMFAVWVLSHMFGGSVWLGETKLYDLMLIPMIDAPYSVLKYDQAVHLFCYLVMAMLLYDICRKNFVKESFMTSAIIVLAASGVGVLNEIVEFSTTIYFPENGVGGYVNNAIDLIFNFVGAIIGVCIARRGRDQ